jgi:alpha-amylase
MSLAKSVLAFIIFTDGIPIVYAGQEQHFNGGNDPANREATWTAGYNTSSELYKFIADANAIRRCIIGGDYEYLTYKVYKSWLYLKCFAVFSKITTYRNAADLELSDIPR